MKTEFKLYNDEVRIGFQPETDSEDTLLLLLIEKDFIRRSECEGETAFVIPRKIAIAEREAKRQRGHS